MKKTSLFVTAGAVTILLGACSSTATPTTETKETKEISDLTLEQVYTKSLEATEDVKSMKVVTDLRQDTSISGQDLTFETASNMEMDIVLEPMAMYQKNTTSVSGLGEEADQSVEMESYFTEDGFFIKDNTSSQWLKMPKEMSDQLLQLNDAQNDPSAQLKQLELFKDDFTFTQDDKTYTLTLKASGDKFNTFLKEQSEELLPAELTANLPTEDLFENISFEDVTYTMVIGKEDFLLDTLDVDMTLNMSIEGETMSIAQDINTEYVEYNTIDEVKVPAEVVETATEQSF